MTEPLIHIKIDMPELNIHEIYKSVVKECLFDFTLDFHSYYGDKSPEEISLKDLRDYAEYWVENHFK